MDVEDLHSQASVDALLQPGPHDHLLLCTQVSPISGTFGDVPHSSPPSVAQGAGMQASTLPCATAQPVARSVHVEPEYSPDRGEQSTPYAPTPKQIRREKRASQMAEHPAGGGLGGGESSEEETMQEEEERPREHLFVLTRRHSREGDGAEGPPMPPSLQRQLV